MRVSGRGQITIPKHLRDRFGMHENVEVDIRPTEYGLLIQKRTKKDGLQLLKESTADALLTGRVRVATS